MNRFFALSSLACLFLSYACSNKGTTTVNTQRLFINSHKTSEGCYLVSRTSSDVLIWDTLCAEIDGFAYSPGQLYEITIDEVKVKKGEDSKFNLVSMESSSPDPKLRLYNIWLLREMNGSGIDMSSKRIMLEINTSDMTAMGNSLCNTYSGPIATLGKEQFSIGLIRSTRRACEDLEIEQTYLSRLRQVETYHCDGLSLMLEDAEGNTVLSYTKVD